MPDAYLTVPLPVVQEGSSFNATASFRVADAGTAPTTAKYRVDCLATGKVLTDWTTLTPAESITIAITSTHNAIQRERNLKEKKQLTVASDPDATDETRAVATWNVKNIRNF